MTEEIYLAEGGEGWQSLYKAPHCALGKVVKASGFVDKAQVRSWAFLEDTLGLTAVQTTEIYRINDGDKNHYKALKLVLQYLQELGHEVVLPKPYFAEVEELASVL